MNLPYSKEFQLIINRYDGDKYVKKLSCLQQLAILFFYSGKGLVQSQRSRNYT
jgi:hypothetical protein